jgi:NADP-dependent 3-hydroxy acid dehydrogenase YdfG
MISMKGKHALVTGASAGIGAKTAELLSRAGATVALTGTNKDVLSRMAES